MAFEEIEPFGERVADARHGIAVAALANVNRDAKKKPDAYQFTDFIPWHAVHRTPVKFDPKAASDRIRHMLRVVAAGNKPPG